MKIAFLAKRKEIHTVKWVNGLARRGHEVHLISMHSGIEKLSEKVILHMLPYKPPLGYFLNKATVQEILSTIKPEILNVHYASGYGTLNTLVNFSPSVLSVWGSDVYIFPKKSFFHKRLVQKNLSAVDKVFSTSKAMADHVKDKLGYKENIVVTPFGIDLNKFVPNDKQSDKIVLGTVKKLQNKYGIDVLLKVFKKLCQKVKYIRPDLLNKIEFLIVGGGEEYERLTKLAKKLKIESKVKFTGYVVHSEVVKYLNKLDVYFALSRVESFGVAVLEASACGIPTIVSDAGGLGEVVDDGKTGFIRELNNLDAIVDITLELIYDSERRKKMGSMGRKFVEQNYSWNHCLEIMERNYKSIIENHKE